MSKKISITEKQAHQFNRMRRTLIKIHKYYQTPAQMHRNSEKDYGLDFEESIGMAYENLQAEALSASKGVKEIVIPQTPAKIKAKQEARELASEAGISQSDFDKQQL